MCGLRCLHLRHFVRERVRWCSRAQHMQTRNLLRRHAQHQTGAGVFRADLYGDDTLLRADGNRRQHARWGARSTAGLVFALLHVADQPRQHGDGADKQHYRQQRLAHADTAAIRHG